MPTGKHLSRGPKTAVISAALFLVVIGILFANGTFAPKSEPVVSGEPGSSVPAPGTPFLEPEPTTHVEIGAIDAVGKGQGQDELWLVQKRGENVTYTKLVIDDHSYCNVGSGGSPCMAMSATYSSAFGGQRVMIDGNKEGDTMIVRRLRVLEEGETPRTSPGSVYIPWVRARDMILSCEAKSLLQTHEGMVQIVTKEGRALVALEPVIDEVFKVANEAAEACGPIGLGTE